MGVLLYGAAAAVGFLAGYFFTWPVLLGVTIACGILSITLHRTTFELERLYLLIFNVLAAVVNAVMWITYYITTEQSWVGEFLRGHILR